MEKIETGKLAALTAYNDGSEETKNVLMALFGKSVFEQKITDRVKSILDVLTIIKPSADQKILLNYDGDDRKMIGAKNFMWAEMIAEVLNEGWIPDYNDESQKKWFGWFDGRSGFAFSFSFCGNWLTVTYSGSRLCFKSEALLLYAVKTFPDVYKEIMKK